MFVSGVPSIGTPTNTANSPPLQHQPPFGLIIPGCPVRTEFTPIDPSGLKFALRLTCPGDIPVPLATVRDLVLFINPSTISSLPVDHGVLVYWQIASMTNPDTACTGYELLGSVTADTPSAVFHTGWSEHEQTSQLLAGPTAPAVIVTIGISIEPKQGNTLFDSTSGGSSNNAATEHRLFIAQKIASDLYRFMQSFDGAGGNNKGHIVVPTNIFDRWFQRFENRFRRDPNFFLRSTE
jgi:protein Hikeshi